MVEKIVAKKKPNKMDVKLTNIELKNNNVF
jgi:hypothetical protein